MTHAEACAALQANAEAYGRDEITLTAWRDEVDRIWSLRFPGVEHHRQVPQPERGELEKASRTNTTPRTPPAAKRRSPAQRHARDDVQAAR